MIPSARAFAAALACALCCALPLGASGQPGVSLTVFAASSLTDAFTEIGRAFDEGTGSRTSFQFAGSQTLRSQLENGARADVYASAAAAQFDPLVKSGLVTGAGPFARNRLVVIVPKRGAGRAKQLRDLAKPGVKLVIGDRNVPVGQYARSSLEAIAKAGLYGPDFAARVLGNVVSEETNARQVTLKVQLAEADAGIVYTTDVTPTVSPGVIQIAIPARFNPPVTYPIGVLEGSASKGAAGAFVAFVRGGEGQAILRKWGFLPPK